MGPAWFLGTACHESHTFCMWTDSDSDEKGYGADYWGEYGDTGDGQGWDLGADRPYWRRRFLILCGGVVALGVCAWLFPAAHQPSKRDAAAASESAAALAKQQALPPAANGPAGVSSSMPDAYPTASATHANTKSTKPKVRASKSLARAKAGACAPADIVLSLFTSQPSYAKGAHPSFSVYAVSTSRTACTLTYGAGAVQIVVTHHGHVVWNSATCKPAPAKTVRFTLGVPQMLAMVWNPRATHPAACAGSLPAGKSATLDAVAMSHGQSSPIRTFKFSTH